MEVPLKKELLKNKLKLLYLNVFKIKESSLEDKGISSKGIKKVRIDC